VIVVDVNVIIYLLTETPQRTLACGVREQQPEMEYALSLAIQHGISAYDAQYVALAASLDAQLVSEDKKLQRVLPGRVVSMTNFTASVQEQDGTDRDSRKGADGGLGTGQEG
jgi:predicted nucleic acid-binding protein